MKKKAGTIAALALCAALTLVGCQGKQNTETAETAPASEVTESTEAFDETGAESTGAESIVEESASTEETAAQENETAAEGADLLAGSDVTVTSSESRTVGDYAYHIDTYEQTWSVGEGAEAAEAFVFKFDYPVFEGDSVVERAVNDFYDEWLTDHVEDLEDSPESDLKFALETREEFAENAAPAWLDSSMVVGVNVRERVIAVNHDSYIYTGGAHGMPGRDVHLFDRETGKETTLEQIITVSKEELNEKVRALFLKLVEEEPEAFFGDAAETLNAKEDFTKNFWFDEEVVIFYTDVYEIAPYAAGVSEVVIPYAELGIA